MADRAPIGQHCRVLHIDLSDAPVRDGVGLARQSFHGHRIGLLVIVTRLRLGRPLAGADRLKRDGQPVGPERAAKAHCRQRTQRVAQEFLFAGPDHLDRPAEFAGQLDRLRIGIGRRIKEMPAKEPAEDLAVDRDLLGGQPEALGDGGLKLLRRLVGHPDLQPAVVVELRDGRGRLKLAVMDILRVIAGRDYLFGRAKRALGIAFGLVLQPLAGLGGQPLGKGRGREIRRHRPDARDHRVRPGLAPVDLQGLGAQLGRPPAFRHDRHGTGQAVDRMHPGIALT